MYNSSKAAVNMLSETARLELAPLGVKVITLVLGAVESHMSKKRTEEIPATSYYRPIKQHLDADPGWNAIPVEKFSRTMVDDVLGGKTGKIYAGGDSLAVKWLIPYIPAWFFVSVTPFWDLNGKPNKTIGLLDDRSRERSWQDA